jgi:anthraniloyl-CoA monooxygenase
VNPAWTLTEAARLGVSEGRGIAWPVQYLPGRDQLVRLLERERAAGSGAAAADRENKAIGV